MNTSSNDLIRESLKEASKDFKQDFEELFINGEINVEIDIHTSYSQLKESRTLWGLFLNAGYVTVATILIDGKYTIRIPNDEVKKEFRNIIADYMESDNDLLKNMFKKLLNSDVPGFMKIYETVILETSSYLSYDMHENIYHMILLGMCAYLYNTHEVSAETEKGYGRCDIFLKAKYKNSLNVVIEMKQGTEDDLEKLASDALEQIKDQKYYATMGGEILLLGIAHCKKRCQSKYEIINYNPS